MVLARRLLGRAAAVLFATTLVLVYHEPGAPTFIWIVLLVLLAILRVARGRFAQVARLGYFVVLAAAVFGVLSFAIDSLRMALYRSWKTRTSLSARRLAARPPRLQWPKWPAWPIRWIWLPAPN